MAAAVLLVAGVGMALPAPGTRLLVPPPASAPMSVSPDSSPRSRADDPLRALAVADSRGAPSAPDVEPVTPATWSLLKRLYRG